MEHRKDCERQFHDQLAKDQEILGKSAFTQKYYTKQFLAVTRSGERIVDEWIDAHCSRSVSLDLCCGTGTNALKLAAHGSTVIGVDISETSLKVAKRAAAEAGYSKNVQFICMDGECLAFADGTFDLIVCGGALHHLELDSALRELARVLKKDGNILCIEPLGHNPLINLYRRFTPRLRTAWEQQNLLRARDLRKAKQYFHDVSVKYCYLATILGILLRRTPVFFGVLCMLERIDEFLLRVPVIRLLAWQVIISLAKPRRT